MSITKEIKNGIDTDGLYTFAQIEAMNAAFEPFRRTNREEAQKALDDARANQEKITRDRIKLAVDDRTRRIERTVAKKRRGYAKTAAISFGLLLVSYGVTWLEIAQGYSAGWEVMIPAMAMTMIAGMNIGRCLA